MISTRSERRGTLRAAILLLAATLGLTMSACPAAKVRPVTGPGGKPAVVFAFLEDGRTSREQVVEELGRPPAEFESGRILAYRLNEEHEPVYAHRAAAYSLILVFDESGTLERHSLVRVR